MESNKLDEAKNDTVKFGYIATTALAKSIAFRTMALQSLKSKEYLLAGITSYYSLFHLFISLMYLCPHKIKESKNFSLEKLRYKWADGAVDPTRIIGHSDVLNFAEPLTEGKMGGNWYQLIKKAQEIRVFINYGPRLTSIKAEPKFLTRKYQLKDCEEIVLHLDDIILEVFDWAKSNSPYPEVVDMVGTLCPQFFEKPDLLYTQWCAEETVTNALAFAKKIEVTGGGKATSSTMKSGKRDAESSSA